MTTDGVQSLAFSFEELAPLLGRGELCLLDNHHVLEANHLGRQSLDLGLGLRLTVG
jgi:hypothetical protein